MSAQTQRPGDNVIPVDVTSLEAWAGEALREGWVEKWVEGAIFPREMAFFLAVCESNGVVNIIESGRQDGYSAEIIGFYVQKQGGLASSIDLESDRERAFRCRERLAGNPNLSLLRGECRTLLGPLLFADNVTPTAVLIDGPKGYLAMGLLLAVSAFPWVKVAAMHNLGLESEKSIKERQTFGKLWPGPHFYEDIPGEIGHNWKALEKAEQDFCTTRRAARLLDSSALGLMQISGFRFSNLVTGTNSGFGLHHPLRFYCQMRLTRLWDRI